MKKSKCKEKTKNLQKTSKKALTKESTYAIIIKSLKQATKIDRRSEIGQESKEIISKIIEKST